MVDVLPPDYFYMPGIFDYNILMPVWAWIILAMVFFGFVMIVGMGYVFLIMRPVAGFGAVGDASTAKGSPTQVFSIWKNRSFVIECMWYYGNVLAYGNPIKKMQMWFHNSEKATGLSAGKPVMITRDGYDGTVDFIAEMAVCEIPKIFNRDWGMELVQKKDVDGTPLYEIVDALDSDGNTRVDGMGNIVQVQQPIMEEVERKDPNGKSYLLSSFADIRLRMKTLERLYPDGIPIPIYQLYDLSKIYQFTPQGQDSLEFGGVTIDDAKEWIANEDKPPKNWFEKNALLLICLVVGIIGVAFVFMAFPITAPAAVAGAPIASPLPKLV